MLVAVLIFFDDDKVEMSAIQALAAKMPEFVKLVIMADVEVETMAIPAKMMKRDILRLPAKLCKNTKKLDGPVEVIILAPGMDAGVNHEAMRQEMAFHISRGPWIPKELRFDSKVWLYSSTEVDASPITARLSS